MKFRVSRNNGRWVIELVGTNLRFECSRLWIKYVGADRVNVSEVEGSKLTLTLVKDKVVGEIT